jgi:hypothetical protein
MEEEEVVVTDVDFEWIASRYGHQRNADGTMTEVRDGTRYTYIRRREWEKKQEPFGPEAQAARERIEKARRLRHGWIGDTEPRLDGHEYALLREVNETELESYCAAEERMTALRLEQRELIWRVGERFNAWADESERAKFFDWFDCSTMYERHADLPNGAVLSADEELLFQDLGRRITAADIEQYDISHIASVRYMDSHPETYPNG